MSKSNPELNQLLALLKPVAATKLHGWRLLLVAAGALCGDCEPDPADLLGYFTGQPLKLKNADDGLRAIALSEAVLRQTKAGLATGQLLKLTPAPAYGRAFALALADGLLGFADGLDFAGVDPDALAPLGQRAFDELGRRAAALEVLAEDLPTAIDDPEVQAELQDLADQSDANVVALYRARQTPTTVQ